MILELFVYVYAAFPYIRREFIVCSDFMSSFFLFSIFFDVLFFYVSFYF